MNLERQRAMGAHVKAMLDASIAEVAAIQRPGIKSESLAAHEIEQASGITEEERRAVVEAHVQGLKAMTAAFDFVGSAVDLSARPERAFSLMAVARSACEAAANVVWYLDPGLTRPKRQSRAMTGVRDALGSARRFGRKARITFSDEQASALDDLEALVNAHPAQSASSPKLEQKLRDIAQTLSLEDRLSDAGLEALSNCAHATKSARDGIVIGWHEDGTPRLTTHVAAEWALWYMSNLLLAAVWVTSQYFGWDPSGWVDEVLPHAEAVQDAINEIRRELPAARQDAPARSLRLKIN